VMQKKFFHDDNIFGFNDAVLAPNFLTQKQRIF